MLLKATQCTSQTKLYEIVSSNNNLEVQDNHNRHQRQSGHSHRY
jgi:hypothetical protein